MEYRRLGTSNLWASAVRCGTRTVSTGRCTENTNSEPVSLLREARRLVTNLPDASDSCASGRAAERLRQANFGLKPAAENASAAGASR